MHLRCLFRQVLLLIQQVLLLIRHCQYPCSYLILFSFFRFNSLLSALLVNSLSYVFPKCICCYIITKTVSFFEFSKIIFTDIITKFYLTDGIAPSCIFIYISGNFSTSLIVLKSIPYISAIFDTGIQL